jgi:hypothetical protein
MVYSGSGADNTSAGWFIECLALTALHSAKFMAGTIVAFELTETKL